MKNYMVRFAMCVLGFGLSACGGSSTETTNNYGAEAVSLTSITVQTVDQFANPVSGRIHYNGELLGVGEVEITFDPAQGGTVGFDSNLTDYAPPAMLDLSVTKFASGERYRATYIRGGPVANVCPRTINAQGNQVDATVSVNGVRVDYTAGYCQAVNTQNVTTIDGGGANSVYANNLFIPAGKLEENGRYTYDLFFGNGEKTIYVATTPASGEMFVDGRSVGWAKDDFLSIHLLPETESEISFGDVLGYQTAESFVVASDDVDYENNHFWGLYDPHKNALTCFSGVQDGGHSVGGKVLIDDETELVTGYDFPGCVGLDYSFTHTAEFLDRENYQSTDVLSIDAINHVGCEGDFIPGGRLDCVGQYYYVQPVQDRTEFYVQLDFTGPYMGNTEYPISGRFELNGIQHEQQSYGLYLKLSEAMTFTLLPVGSLQPSQTNLTIDAATLTESDAEYNPETNQWIYTVAYVPPVGAVEACVTSWNQNFVSIGSEVGMTFDGAQQLNAWEEDEDCHWLTATGNHVIVPNWLTGYQHAVSEIHVPEGKLAQQSHFDMLYIPTPTYHQLCISGVTVEAGLRLNNYFLGWTYLGEVCVRMDKSIPNTLTIEGVGSRSYAADDPALAGTYSNVEFQSF